VSGVGVHLGGVAVVIAHVHVSQQEDPLPGHQHIVEEDHCIHLFESGAQRVVEVGPALVQAFPAHEFDSRRVARDREGESLTPGVVSQKVAPGGIYGDLVGDRSQGRQHAAALDDDARVGLPHHRQRHLFVQVIGHPRNAAFL